MAHGYRFCRRFKISLARLGGIFHGEGWGLGGAQGLGYGFLDARALYQATVDLG